MNSNIELFDSYCDCHVDASVDESGEIKKNLIRPVNLYDVGVMMCRKVGICRRRRREPFSMHAADVYLPLN